MAGEYVADTAGSYVIVETETTAASGNNCMAAAGADIKNFVVQIIISVDTAGLVTFSDGIGSVYLAANTPFSIDFIPAKPQDTANTAITCTNAGGGNFATIARAYQE